MPRYPLPRETLELRGSNKAKYRVPVGTVKAGSPVIPAWLTGHARTEWRRVAPILTQAGLLSPADLGTLAAYCLAVAEVRDCTEQLDKDGLTVTNNGQTYPNPLLKVRASAAQRVRALGAELALTPASRKRAHIATGGPEKPDPLDEYLGPFKMHQSIPHRNRNAGGVG